MKNLFIDLRCFWRDLWFGIIKSRSEKTKRFIWTSARGIKIQWDRLWVRKDEFHSSLNMDANAMLGMSQKQRSAYTRDLYRRRRIAHERDLINVIV